MTNVVGFTYKVEGVDIPDAQLHIFGPREMSVFLPDSNLGVSYKDIWRAVDDYGHVVVEQTLDRDTRFCYVTHYTIRVDSEVVQSTGVWLRGRSVSIDCGYNTAAKALESRPSCNACDGDELAEWDTELCTDCRDRRLMAMSGKEVKRLASVS